MSRTIRKILIFIIMNVIFLSLISKETFADNERYKAIPMASGGYVFILDTREGHAWTWSASGGGQVSSSGKNSKFVYQGNIRKNMSPPKNNMGNLNIPSGQSERF